VTADSRWYRVDRCGPALPGGPFRADHSRRATRSGIGGLLDSGCQSVWPVMAASRAGAVPPAEGRPKAGRARLDQRMASTPGSLRALRPWRRREGSPRTPLFWVQSALPVAFCGSFCRRSRQISQTATRTAPEGTGAGALRAQPGPSARAAIAGDPLRARVTMTAPGALRRAGGDPGRSGAVRGGPARPAASTSPRLSRQPSANSYASEITPTAFARVGPRSARGPSRVRLERVVPAAGVTRQPVAAR